MYIHTSHLFPSYSLPLSPHRAMEKARSILKSCGATLTHTVSSLSPVEETVEHMEVTNSDEVG